MCSPVKLKKTIPRKRAVNKWLVGRRIIRREITYAKIYLFFDINAEDYMAGYDKIFCGFLKNPQIRL